MPASVTGLLPQPASPSPPDIPSFLELEITGFCQLRCVHCYAESGPHGGRGTMTTADWEKVIDQAAEIGVTMVQFIGGEPALDPDLPRLIRYALGNGLKVYVYSNLVHVAPEPWELFSRAAGRAACPVRDRPLAGLRQRPGHSARRPAVRPGVAAYADPRAPPC